MAKPFGNMAQLTGDILDSYIMGLQAGSTPDDAGLDEMKYVRVDKLRRYIREGLVTAYTPRENSSIATPSSPQVGDIFMCTGEFTESGITYQLNHFYVYTTQLAWEDITAGIKGPKGDIGVTPLLSIGEVTYGDTPDVTIDTTDPAHPVLDFVLKTSEVGVVDNLNSSSSVDALSARQGSMLSNACSALDKRVTNLELKTGDQFDVDYPSDTYGMDGVPSNVEPYAEVKALKGVGRVRNNLGKAINSTNWIPYSTTYSSTSFADGIVTMSWKANVPDGENFRYGIRQSSYYKVYANHLYLISYEIYSSKDLRYVDESLLGSYLGPTPAPICEANKWTKIAYVVSASANNDTRSSLIYPNYNQSFVEGDYYRVRNYILTDLSVYFNTLDLSWIGSTYAERIATIQQRYPQLLIPSDYGTEVVFPTYTAVKSVGRNLWDEVWEEGDIKYSTGVPQGNSNYIRSVNFCEVKANTSIYVKGNNTIWLLWYDANYGYLGGTNQDGTAGGTVVTSPANARYFKLVNRKIVFDGKICINVSDSQNGTYSPYMTDTLTIPNPIPLRSAGSAQDTDELNVEVDGVQRRRNTQKISSYVFNGATDVSSSSTAWMANCYSFRISTAKSLELDAKVTVNSLCSNYIINMTPDSVVGSFWLYKDAEGLVIYINHDNNTMGMTAFKALLQSSPIEFNFVRDTPIVTLLDPIPDPYIKVEPNGTIKPVQSQSPEVDSAMTVEYMAS